MENPNLKVFKLQYSGEIETLESENLIELFSLIHILAFYITGQKRLYIWVGEYASRTLKNYIVRIRELFTDDYPEFRVLRYITIESLTEPFEFFQNTDISKEDLHERIGAEKKRYEEHKQIINEITKLKEQADNQFENQEYEKAVETATECLALAEKVEDEALIEDLEDFIDEAEARAKAKAILDDIRREKKVLKNRFNSMKKDEDIVDIHDDIQIFKEKYDEYLDLPALSDVQDLIKKVEELWDQYNSQQQAAVAKEQRLELINKLRKEGIEALELGQFKKSIEAFNKITELLKDDVH